LSKAEVQPSPWLGIEEGAFDGRFGPSCRPSHDREKKRQN
jgi:hypothetical protein